jgi:transposase-like protein
MAVSAVLDNRMTQVVVCKQHGIKSHHLRAWIAEERARRVRLEDIHNNRAAETTEARLRRLAGEWGNEPGVFAGQIKNGLKKAEWTRIFYDYVIGGPLLLVAGILGFLVSAFCVVIIFDQLTRVESWPYVTAIIALAAVLALVVTVAIWEVAQYFKALIFRTFAPFAYAATSSGARGSSWTYMVPLCSCHHRQTRRRTLATR